MVDASVISQKHSSDKPGLGFWLLVSVCGLATLGIAFTGMPALTLVPVVVIAIVAAVLTLPLRIPTLALLFLALVLENPADKGQFSSPLLPLGELLLVQLKKVIPIDALVVTGLDASLAALLIVRLVRRLRGQNVDSHVVAAPAPLLVACLVSIGGIMLSWMYGLAMGGDFNKSLWQMVQMVHLPWITLAFALLLPGPGVARPLGVIVVTAGLIKATMAVLLSFAYPGAEFQTSHQDSVLFAAAGAFMLIHFIEKPNKKTALINLLLQPPLLLGMIKNDRRIVWVELAMGVAVVGLLTDWSWLKYRLLKLAIAGIPAGIMYLAVGWNTSGTGIFRPVGTLKSMADSKSDASTLWRDLENFNLNATLASNPLLGTGLGHKFLEEITLPDVTSQYPLEFYVPHNSVLGLWAFTGYLGFTAWWLLLVTMMFYAIRGYHATRAPPLRVACMMTPAILFIYMIQSFGDVGLGCWHGVLLAGSAAAVSSKIAVASGALVEPRITPPGKEVSRHSSSTGLSG